MIYINSYVTYLLAYIIVKDTKCASSSILSPKAEHFWSSCDEPKISKNISAGTHIFSLIICGFSQWFKVVFPFYSKYKKRSVN